MKNELENIIAKSKKTSGIISDKNIALNDTDDLDLKTIKRVFTFSKGDYSSVYNEADYSNNDETVIRLLEITKFSNIKTSSRVNAYRIKNAEMIAELNNDTTFNRIDEEMNNYSQVLFSDKIINYIIYCKEQELLRKEQKNRIFHSEIKSIQLDFSGIILSLNTEVHNQISDKYLWIYDWLKTLFKKEHKNRVKRIERHIQFEGLDYIYECIRHQYLTMFERDWISELRKIIFNNYKDQETPRIFDNTEYSVKIDLRIDQMMNSEFMRKSLTIAEKSHEK